MNLRKSGFLILAIVTFLAAAPASAQELVYGQRDYQVSYDGKINFPSLAFNGVDYAVFYYWSGVEDAGSGLYMRRLDKNGKPQGSQRLLQALNISYAYLSAVWDGSAYIVFISKTDGADWRVFRINTQGNVLAQRSVAGLDNHYLRREMFPFVVGDRAFLFYCSGEAPADQMSYMVSVDSTLKTSPTVEELPTGGLKNTALLGVTIDPEKFLVFLGDYTTGGFGEVGEAALLHLDFNGDLIKSVRPAGTIPRGSNPAEKLDTTDVREVAGPMYTGDGYLLFGYRNDEIAGTSYPYYLTSIKIDDTGEILEGPFKIGGGDSIYSLGIPVLFGQKAGLPISDAGTATVAMNFFGAKGKHINNVDVHESSASYKPESVSAVYSGSGITTAYHTPQNPTNHTLGSAIYSNMISDSASVKPGISYFQASSANAFGDTRRLIMWSISGGTNISLKGKGFKMKSLPPVFHTVVDTKGKKTKLRLRFKGTDGKNKKSKLVIKP